LRFLLLVLFVLNLAVAGLSALDHFQRTEGVPYDEAQKLMLLGEGAAAEEESSSEVGGVDPVPQSATVAPRNGGSIGRGQLAEISTCLLVGPINSPIVLEESKRLFGVYGVPVQELAEEVGEKSEYWVYIPPFESKKIADSKLVELRELGFESVPISQGEFRGGVSLGLFNARESAVELVKQLGEKKIGSEIKELKKKSNDRRLLTASEVPRNIKSELLALLAALDSSLEHKEIICK
tara:strand:- start:64 stop:774 length:711 start_codon:yes stop_codon:yes gene_type:complete